MIYPQRQLDPYDENEVKGTRMPDYTKLAKERDIYGELGWIQNFNVKFSKNNHKLHPTYREFFDGPKNYHNQFNNSTLTNSEFFRQNAPPGSVARIPSVYGSGQKNPNSSVGFKTFNEHKRSRSKFEGTSQMGGSMYDTPFVLEKEKNNRHRVEKQVETTMVQSSEIPFLRTQIDAFAFSKTHNGGFGNNVFTESANRSFSQGMRGQAQVKRVKQLKKKEQGWDNYIKPISKYNSQVHPSMRIPFEQI